MINTLVKNKQYYKFCLYGFLKNLRFFDAFFLLFLLTKGMSYTEIGILYATREIVINVFEIPSGIFADTYGRKNSLVISFLLYIVSFVAFYSSDNFWVFFMAFILYGMGDAFRSGTHKAMIMDYLKLNQWYTQKINYYGHTRACSQKGSAISSLVAGLIVFYYGNYYNIFLFSIIPYLLNLILILSYPKELNHSFNGSEQKSHFNMGETFKTLVKIVKQPNVLRILNSSAMHTAYQKSVKDYIQPLMLNVVVLLPIMTSYDEEKKNGITIGIIYFIIYLITSRASQLASKISKLKRKNITYLTMIIGFIFGVTTGVFYLKELWLSSLIAFVGIYTIESIRKPILTGVLADNVPNEILTSTISVQSLWRTMITAVLALVIGLLADYFGIGIAFIVITSVLLIATLLFTKKKSFIQET
jgi:MFS family permease